MQKTPNITPSTPPAPPTPATRSSAEQLQDALRSIPIPCGICELNELRRPSGSASHKPH
jgi:hypothetical protein